MRPTPEYKLFILPKFTNLPNSKILSLLQTLKEKDNFPVLHYAGRTRSIIGACTLLAAGYSARFYVFKGGTQAWELSWETWETSAKRVVRQLAENHVQINELVKRWGIKINTVDIEELSETLDQKKITYFLMFQMTKQNQYPHLTL